MNKVAAKMRVASHSTPGEARYLLMDGVNEIHRLEAQLAELKKGRVVAHADEHKFVTLEGDPASIKNAVILTFDSPADLFPYLSAVGANPPQEAE